MPMHSREELDFLSVSLVIIPPVISYYVLSVLICLPGTRTWRNGLMPIVLFLAYRAATTVDLSFANERMVYLNKGLVLAMSILSFRSIVWAQSKKPYKRLQRVKHGSEGTPSESRPASNDWRQLQLDASDLAFGLRGIGWNWSQGLHIPPEKRSTSSDRSFAFWTLASLVTHIPVFDLLHYSVQRFGPGTFATTSGGSIFDESVPPLIRYSRSTFLSLLSGLVVYCAIEIAYDFCTLIGIVVLRQSPTQWPPIFDEPWRADSLSDFWAKRWHQLFRHFFIGLGWIPLYHVFGRIGGVFGAFLVSGILHYVGLWGLGSGSDVLGMIGFFMLMGVGVILEGFWKSFTGYKVKGWLGRIWTTVWLLGWSNLLVDAWARKGLMGSLFIPDSRRLPVQLFGVIPTQ
ncbi:membrane bound O-acyl transferase family-domain-containing protein [Lentinula edodes]|uniref:membrane bound O-acyl transferase family-domain-containing protein n=1 Tax=Lentinula edodes TaxID=5353 RepID=UPI001E8CC7E7|nr:membrane bound O-acyl transferase family-domain-containing protein [Lentinula edodes]KAH7873903.1 membrane bound O-acyl transferase family-domain-containing protein [Lentinula edodes]